MYPMRQLCTTLNKCPVWEEKVIKVIGEYDSLLNPQKAGWFVWLGGRGCLFLIKSLDMNMLQVPCYSVKGLFKNTLFIGKQLSSLRKLKLATTVLFCMVRSLYLLNGKNGMRT